MSAIVHIGDVLTILPTLPAASVNCVVTSPPYWGLRSYLNDDDPDKPLELGLEKTPDCGRRDKFRLRSDLTNDQREYVARRLVGVERSDV